LLRLEPTRKGYFVSRNLLVGTAEPVLIQ